MSSFFNDLNKLVNTVQKVDKLLTEKPKRRRYKINKQTTFNEALRPLCDWLAASPKNELIGNLNAIIDNLNEFGTDYTITLKTTPKSQ